MKSRVVYGEGVVNPALSSGLAGEAVRSSEELRLGHAPEIRLQMDDTY